MNYEFLEECLRCLRDVEGVLPIDVDPSVRAELLSVISRLESAKVDGGGKNVAMVLQDALCVIDRIVTLFAEVVDFIQNIWH